MIAVGDVKGVVEVLARVRKPRRRAVDYSGCCRSARGSSVT